MVTDYMDAIMIILFLEEEVGEELRDFVTAATSRCWLISPAQIQGRAQCAKFLGITMRL